jgi:hypothetical protein
MAGKPKYGLEYFSLDVDVINNTKIKRLKRTHGNAGFAAYIQLLTIIYSKSYFWKYDQIENVQFEIAEFTSISDEEALAMINYMVKINLFDKTQSDKGYLTSKDIQTRYYQATKRRKVRMPEGCCILSEEEKAYLDKKSVYNNSISVNNDDKDVNNDTIHVNNDKQSKSKSESKRKSKRDKIMINNDIAVIDSKTIPFQMNYYLKVLIDNNIVEGTEEWVPVLNDFLYVMIKEYEKEVVSKAIYYTIKRINKINWKDELGFNIENKEKYLEETILNNIIYNENENYRISNTKSFIKEYSNNS